MKSSKILLITATLAHAAILTSAHAAVIASTDFNSQTITGAVASDLNWTTNGVDDPGSMTALNAATANQNLFNGAGKITQDMFAPALNTGNGNTFWTTNISLTVSSGSTVTLEDITFDYWAINGGEAQNVSRKSDFTVTLLNPSSTSIGTESINDVVNDGAAGGTPGLGTPVTLTFATAIALTAPGTYTLEIKGGDYAGDPETGNHTAIDNLFINGTFSTIPEPSTLFLSALGVMGIALRRKRAL